MVIKMDKRFEWDSALGKVYDYDKPVEDTFESYREWELVDLLNEQDVTIKELEKENKELKKQKERYKRLSEIRSEEINNRILTIKEFIDDCSDEEIKEVLNDLFYSEVNEYDLSKKYRGLHEENEELKAKVTGLENDWKQFEKDCKECEKEKNLTAKQLQVVIEIIKELNVVGINGDVE